MINSNIFSDKIEKDFDFMDSIWINFPETKEIRINVAKEIWETLYFEHHTYTNLYNSDLEKKLALLLPFKEFTTNNIELTSKIVGDFFIELRNNWGDTIPTKIIKEEADDLLTNAFSIEKFGANKLKLKQKQFENKKKMFEHDDSELVDEQLHLEEDELEFLQEILEEYKKILFDMKKNNKEVVGVEEDTALNEQLEKLSLTLEEIEKHKANWVEIQEKMSEYFSSYYEQLKASRDLFHDPDLIPGMGWDLGKGQLTHNELHKFLEISQSLKDNHQINKLVDELGRSNSKKKLKKNHGINKDKPTYFANKKDSPKELLGINYGSDLARVFPSELINLKNPELKKVFYAKYLEDKLMQYRLAGENDKNESAGKVDIKYEKGPIIACIDTSTSMKGLPEEICKGITINLYNKCKKEKRKLYLIIFSSIDELVEMEITDKTNFSILVDFLQQSFFGGTDYTTPLKRSIQLIDESSFNFADILMISDGLSQVEDEFLEYLNTKRKELEFKIYSLIISHRIETDSYSDKIINYKIELSDQRWKEKFYNLHRKRYNNADIDNQLNN